MGVLAVSYCGRIVVIDTDSSVAAVLTTKCSLASLLHATKHYALVDPA